jgi:ATP-dependent Clp protease protease subunit
MATSIPRLPQTPAASVTPRAGTLSRKWTYAQLAAALDALTLNQRVVVSLRYLAGLAPKEISAFLGLSRVSVRKRLHDGLARLRGMRDLPLEPPRPEPRPIPVARKEDLMARIPNVLEKYFDSPKKAEDGDSSEPGPRHILTVNLMDRLLMDRIVFLSGRIDMDAATSATIQLLFLQKENREQPVHVYVCSPGGDLFAGLAVYDTMQFLACPVHTYAIGQAAGVAALVVAAGEPGSRFALPNAALMLYQPPVGEGEGLEEHYLEAAAAGFRARLVDLLAKHTKVDRARIELDLARGLYLPAEEAREYGLVDQVVGSLRGSAGPDVTSEGE